MHRLKILLLLCICISCRYENDKFKQIKYSNSYCEGECPVYELDIKQDGLVTYNSIAFNKEVKGEYLGYLDEVTKKKLEEYFKKTNISNLKEVYYETNYVDHPCSEFVFYMDNNNVIKTQDCSYSYDVDILKELYPIILNIKDSTIWYPKQR
jgi:hypothetical protein